MPMHPTASERHAINPASSVRPSPGAFRAPVERRQFGRRTTLWHAWIVTPGQRRIACKVRNVSEGGALLELPVPEWLPAKFSLAVDEQGIVVACELRHRGRHGVGVTFADIGAGLQLYALSHQSPARPVHTAPIDDTVFKRPSLTPELIRKGLLR